MYSCCIKFSSFCLPPHQPESEMDIYNCFTGEKPAPRSSHHIGNAKLEVLHTTRIDTLVPKHDDIILNHWTLISQTLFLCYLSKAFRSLIYGTMQIQKNCHHHQASINVLPKLGLRQASSNSSKTTSFRGQQKTLHQFWTHRQLSGVLWHKAIYCCDGSRSRPRSESKASCQLRKVEGNPQQHAWRTVFAVSRLQLTAALLRSWAWTGVQSTHVGALTNYIMF